MLLFKIFIININAIKSQILFTIFIQNLHISRKKTMRIDIHLNQHFKFHLSEKLSSPTILNDQKTFIKSVKISFNAQICEKVFHQISLFLISNTINQESNTNRVKSYAAKRCPVSRGNLWAQKGVQQ